MPAAVVLDNGSSACKIGFAGENEPRKVLPALLPPRRRRRDELDPVQRQRNFMASRPIERGVVWNWDDMEKIWSHAFFNVLEVRPEERPVLLTEAPLNPTTNREMMLHIMFGKLNVPAVHVAIPAVLALYAASNGGSTGVVLDCGDAVSHTVPIYEGFSVPHAMLRMELAGQDLTEYLQRLLRDRGILVPIGRDAVQAAKEEYCYVALDYRAKMDALAQEDEGEVVQLKGGQKVALGSERFRCPEALFQPSLVGNEGNGIHHLIYESVQKCPVDMRKDLYQDIVLSGGTSMMRGFTQRIERELRALVPVNMNIKVIPPTNGTMAWLGGSIQADMNERRMWIYREDYMSFGPSGVLKKEESRRPSRS